MNSAQAPRRWQPIVCAVAGIALLVVDPSHARSQLAHNFSTSTAQDPTSQNTKLAAIEELVKNQQYAQAVTALTDLLQKDSHRGAEAYRLLAFSQLKLQHPDHALTTCEQGLVLYPASVPLGELYVPLMHQAVDGAERQTRLTELSKRIPSSPIVAKALGEELIANDPQSPEALQLLSSAVRLAPLDPEARFFYGEAACFNKQDAICIQELTRAHELSPKNRYADMQLFTMIAVAEDRLKQPARAEQAFERSMKANEQLSAHSPYAALKYVNFLTTQAKDKEAERVIDEMLKWDSSYGPGHFARAKLLAQQGTAEDAAREAELALQDERATPTEQRTYHAFLAKTYFALGRESDARIHQDWIEAHQAATP